MPTASSRRELRIQYLEENLRAKAWRNFIYRINYPHSPGASTAIFATIPPTYIHSHNDRWEYLRQIAAGFVLIPGCGLVCRGNLAQFLRENDPVEQSQHNKAMQGNA